MCIVFRACADPTSEGVWWRDDAAWRQYDPSNQKKILDGISNNLGSVDLGTISSGVYPSGARYVADLRKMEQKNVRSGQERKIMVIPRIPQPVQRQTPMLEGLRRNNIAVHYRNSAGELAQYDPDLGQALLRACMNGDNVLSVPNRSMSFDICKMKAFHWDEGTRKVYGIVIEVPLDYKTMALCACENMRMRRKVIEMVVENMRFNELPKVLANRSKPHTVVSARLNQEINPKAAVYQGFINLLEGVVERRNCLESFVRMASVATDPNACAESGMQIGFRLQKTALKLPVLPVLKRQCVVRKQAMEKHIFCSFVGYSMSVIKGFNTLLVFFVASELPLTAPRYVEDNLLLPVGEFDINCF